MIMMLICIGTMPKYHQIPITMSRPYQKVSKTKMDGLSAGTLRDLNLLSRFYFEVITANSRGIVRKPTPKDFLKFLKNDYKKQLNSLEPHDEPLQH
ncbi:hypothetical protein BAA08_15890 [Bizionia sp. APA-3]|nr:hypothetical protein BAA08_15890 [Bizionia sp. APA-3]